MQVCDGVPKLCLLSARSFQYKILHRLRPCQVVFLRKCTSLHSKTHYQVLDINQRADNKEIRAAYIAKCKKYHPDASPGDSQAQQKFIRLQEAYHVLSDPKKRTRYDVDVYRVRRDTQTEHRTSTNQKQDNKRHKQHHKDQQSRKGPADVYRHWSNHARQQEEMYGQWTGQQGKYGEWIKENKNRYNSNQEHGDHHSEFYNEAYYQQKYYDMFGPFGCLVDSFFGNKESKQASFQAIFLLFTLVNIFTFLGCVSGIYLIKDITESARKWQQVKK